MQITHDLRIGGLQRVILDLCKNISRDRFEVSVCCLRQKSEFAEEIEAQGIPVILLPQKKKGTDYLSFLKLYRILKSKRPDIIHLHNSQPLIDGTISALMAHKPKIVYTDHARDFPDKQRIMFIEGILSKFVNQIVGVSDHTAKNLMKYERMNPKKIVTIVNGIDEKKYRININKAKKKEELGITRFGPIIGLFGRLCSQKGIIYLLRAAPDIIKHYPNLLVLIVGEGPLRESLEIESEKLNIGGNVKFVGPRLDIPEILSILDVYVLSSLWEGLPLVLLEAMAAGIPIVTTRVGGIPSVIMNDDSGILVEPRRPDLLGQAIVNVLSDKKIAKRLAKNAYIRFRKDFTVEKMLRRYEDIYESLIIGRDPKSNYWF